MKSTNPNTNWLPCAAMALMMAAPVAANAQSAAPDIVVTEKDNGKDVTLHGSQRLIVRLSQPGGPSNWSALMRPDSILAFTENPVAEGEKREYPATTAAPTAARPQPMMVGGSHDVVFAFRPVSFTESSGQWFTLIFCTAQCDLKSSSAKIFKLGITTKKS